MGQLFWISGLFSAVALLLGVWTVHPDKGVASADEVFGAFAAAEIAEPQVLVVGDAGSALATAAFGMSALQPETYNGELVFDIIDASPLTRAEKRALFSNLIAAEEGRADLDRVLAEVRVALALN